MRNWELSHKMKQPLGTGCEHFSSTPVSGGPSERGASISLAPRFQEAGGSEAALCLLRGVLNHNSGLVLFRRNFDHRKTYRTSLTRPQRAQRAAMIPTTLAAWRILTAPLCPSTLSWCIPAMKRSNLLCLGFRVHTRLRSALVCPSRSALTSRNRRPQG